MSSTSSVVAVNQTTVASQSSAVSDAASYLVMRDLSSKDTKTTISANDKSKQVFLESQLLIECLGMNMDTEAENIHSMGLEFKEYDEMLAEFVDLGER